ncbi:methylenetetrahydrofolate reductase [NAD(P)H] [Candidatus Methylopumilus planktonicus]|jgi:methylenetetrahydrofolate reductase (NADPH)|uniref:methylenetetrahydrofolate reductase [NAD(P)H] n=1 Tax=Candidatus Methylopumilus planktonicus TaxID=1581557 RepID=UPI0011212838|nr:methylenetetrahydrofolate reductase [NAD(P)H] [Candidatus Methylopumilus planktonicus]MDH4407197.1 methylenetetrahydrofolate reductase [NAD(P)H] [Candidatus Methylopumilus sp.]QDD10347.1 methylenetetrahydrofolate reductase [NAD(P)H] [Candidatus Methylopumilus planktonicus]QDD22817.1 methylenetetrahydrofolate reductase [NAD(P)H] [Candidatus Methylopumilus planktonicus]
MPRKISYSFEFFPPSSPEGIKNSKDTRQQLSAFKPEFYSVTFGAGGSTRDLTLETVLEIKQEGFNAVPHISGISSTKAEIKTLLDLYQQHDIKHLVVLRGDVPHGAVSRGEFKHANELVSFIRQETNDYFHIEVGAYPEYHPEAVSSQTDIQNFKNKVDAGANSAITQFFFNADAYFRFMDECLIADINIPIVPGVMPIYNIKQLARFASNCGAEIPRWLRIKLESYGDDLPSLRSYGVDVVSELCETLIEWDVPSLHFYTLNQAGIITRIIKNIEGT